jgi:hypothetical protein
MDRHSWFQLHTSADASWTNVTLDFGFACLFTIKHVLLKRFVLVLFFFPKKYYRLIIVKHHCTVAKILKIRACVLHTCLWWWSVAYWHVTRRERKHKPRCNRFLWSLARKRKERWCNGENFPRNFSVDREVPKPGYIPDMRSWEKFKE